MPDSFRLDGKVALFTAAGARVLFLDLDRAKSDEVVAQTPGSEAILCDITNEDLLAQAFMKIQSLDILVNCAGIGLVGNVEETTWTDWQKLFKVNVDGTFLTIKVALPLLLDSHGSILNIGSVAGMVGVKRRFAYCATKGAIHAMTRQLAVDYPTQIRVNCIAPGTVDTPFVEGYLEKYHRHEKDKVRSELNQRQPMGRLGQPGEIADLALYISSPAAAFMTGSVVTIDGGFTAA